jgi:hypothetical protein
MSGAVQVALKAGKTVDQMKAKILAACDTQCSGDFINSDGFIDGPYNSLTNRKDRRS